jgi:hypothetical protein
MVNALDSQKKMNQKDHGKLSDIFFLKFFHENAMLGVAEQSTSETNSVGFIL